MSEVIVHESMDLKISQLIFDPENPRLPESIDSNNEEEVIDWMIRKTSLLDLVSSIIDNGYFPGEPLLVTGITSGTNKGKYKVVEGNRRLASLKLIKSSSLAGKRKKSLSNLLERDKGLIDFNKIPVIRFTKRNNILKYLGYRHVTGTKSWSPLSKSKYLYELRHSDLYKKMKASEVYTELAYSIGSKGHYVKRFIACYELFRELEKQGFFKENNLEVEEIEYSTFYDSLSKNNISSYCKINYQADNALEEVDLLKVKELVKILFVKDGLGNTKIGESRNISILNEIYGNEVARNHFLKKKVSIDEAYRLLNTAEDQIREALLNIIEEISYASKAMSEVKNYSFLSKHQVEKVFVFIEKLRG